MAVSKRLRFEILRRDNHTCRYCGATAPEVKLTIDHVIPVALGGKDEPSNLVAACSGCNAGKSSATPDQSTVDQVTDDAVRWARAQRYAIKDMREAANTRYAQIAEFDAAWSRWSYERSGEPVPRPDDWDDSVSVWLDRGLTVSDMTPWIQKAMTGQRTGALGEWRYFCGIVWRTLDEVRDRTVETLRDDEEWERSADEDAANPLGLIDAVQVAANLAVRRAA